MGQLLVQAKRKMFLTEENGNENQKQLIINEEGMRSITKHDRLMISPERRKTVHMAMHQIVQARMHDMPKVIAARSASVEQPVTRSITHQNPSARQQSELDIFGEADHQMYKKFNEILTEQFNLVNFHKHQFEATMNSKMNVDNLPDHMRIVLSKGLTGINNYMRLLDAIKTMQGKENLREKFRNTERHMNDAIKTISNAEDRVDRVFLQMGMKSNRVPIHSAPKDKATSHREEEKRSQSYPPQTRNYEQKEPKDRYEEERKGKQERVPRPKGQSDQVIGRPDMNSHGDSSPEEGRTPRRQKMIYKEKQFQEDRRAGKTLAQDPRASAKQKQHNVQSSKVAINDSDEGEGNDPQNQNRVRENEKMLENMLSDI